MQSITHYYQYSILGKIPQINEKLDPISVLATLALLKYKESLTLLGFKGYQLVTEPPTRLQGTIRRVYCESREDLDFIPIALAKAARWFQPGREENQQYRQLFIAAQQGLDSLCQTYREKHSIVADAIGCWKDSIDAYISTAADEEQSPGDSNLDEAAAAIFALWNTNEIGEVNNLIFQMQKAQGDVLIDEEVRCQDEIERLESLLKQKGKKLKKIYAE